MPRKYLDAIAKEEDRGEGHARQALPEDRRRIITSHDAFGYFAKAYHVDFIAPEGVSTDSEASASDVAKIIDQIKAEKITAVFVENISDPRLVERIVRRDRCQGRRHALLRRAVGTGRPGRDLSRHVPEQPRGSIAGAVVLAFGASSFETGALRALLRMRSELLMVRSGRSSVSNHVAQCCRPRKLATGL